MPKEAVELLEGYMKLQFDYDEIPINKKLAKFSAINDLNNTIKALQYVYDKLYAYDLPDNDDLVADLITEEIDKYQQLLNEIQNEQ